MHHAVVKGADHPSSMFKTIPGELSSRIQHGGTPIAFVHRRLVSNRSLSLPPAGPSAMAGPALRAPWRVTDRYQDWDYRSSAAVEVDQTSPARVSSATRTLATHLAVPLNPPKHCIRCEHLVAPVLPLCLAPMGPKTGLGLRCQRPLARGKAHL